MLNALQTHVRVGSNDVPKFSELRLPAETTTDPFTGDPLHVKKTPQGWLVYSVVYVHGAWQGGWKVWSFGASLERAGWVALYTAVLAPYLFWLLERSVPLLGLQPHTPRR